MYSIVHDDPLDTEAPIVFLICIAKLPIYSIVHDDTFDAKDPIVLLYYVSFT
jgi:hypothetical protein